MNYYCLIAGLPDIEIEDNKLTFSLVSFKEELRHYLSRSDFQLISLYYTKFDNQNLLRYLKNKEVEFDNRGNIAKDELEEYFKQFGEDIVPKNKHIPLYFKCFLEEYWDEQNADKGEANWENRLTELYYQWAMRCDNRFITSWFEFNLNLNNILAACISRKYKIDMEPMGNNEVAEAIKTSRQRDFGLKEIIEELDISEMLDDENFDLFEREKDLDLLKWQWLDRQTFFEYFSIERVFAYMLQLEIIERWLSLNPEKGGKIFRELINNLKDNVVKHK